LKTPFQADGVVTAGSASQISDGAAALAVTTSSFAALRGLRPLARVHTAVVAADDPVIMLTAPMPATAKALRKSGLALSDIGVYEVNEAFAPVPLAWLAETGADPARLNPRGGAIALGHPLGASGARLMTTMMHHMRQTNTRYGLQTMCEGGGMANATIVELL
jgi:acetyl-CoA acyltransferase